MVGKVPDQVIRVFVEFADICYIVRRNDYDQNIIDDLRIRINEFFRDVKIFKTLGVRENFNLPRQHAMRHYPDLMEDFAAMGGSDTSITENLHISIVKRPWRRSNHNNAMAQMLTTNLRLEKLAAMQVRLEMMADLEPRYGSAPVAIFLPKRNKTPSADSVDGEGSDEEDEDWTDNEGGMGRARLAQTAREFCSTMTSYAVYLMITQS